MKALPLVPVLALLLHGCAAPPTSHRPGKSAESVPESVADEPDGLCPAMQEFVEAVPAGGRHEVTLMADWTGEPGLFCKRTRVDHDEKFCGYLIRNSSAEFMGANIKRAYGCLGAEFPFSSADVVANKVQGSHRVVNPELTKRKVAVELEFNSEVGKYLPYLTIAVTPLEGT